MAEMRLPEAAGFVLAGGQSSRMGSDKALVHFGGKPLIAHALAILHEAGLQASIAGSLSDLSPFAPVIPDPGAGPLSGICAALAQMSGELAVFLPVDMPLLPVSLIKALLDHARISGAAATVPSINGFAQTFPVILDRAALPSLEIALQRNVEGCFAAFRQASTGLAQPFSVIRTEMLVQSGQVTHPAALPAAYWFLNLNTPEDLGRAEALAGAVA